MADRTVWSHLRNVTTVLSLGNVVSAYVERAAAGGSTSVAELLRDDTVRLRFWITAALLGAVGVLLLGHLLVSTRDVASDLHPESVRQRIVALAFGAAQIVLAAFFAVLLFATG